MSRFVAKTLVAVSALLLVPISAGASDDVEAQLKAMQERMSQLENKLQSTTDDLQAANGRLEQQQELLNRTEIEKDATSGVADFLETLEFGGHISGGYLYNFESPDGDVLTGFNNGRYAFYPLHPDAESFSVDQVWFTLARPTGEENRAGFQLDIVMGKTAEILNGGSTTQSGNFEQFHLYQAYVEYLAPVGNGLKVQFGKMGTWIGAEVVDATANFNITRGVLWTLFEPITNVGIRSEYTFDNGFYMGWGAVNGTRQDADTEFANSNKAFVGKLGWSGDTVGAQLAATWGETQDNVLGGWEFPDGTHASNHEGILNALLTWNPNDKFSGYASADFIQTQDGQKNSNTSNEGWGVSVAGRYAITERAGFALRGEYVDLKQTGPALQGINLWNVTGTVDYQLTDHLMVRGEVRYDHTIGMSNESAPGGLPFCQRHTGCAGTNGEQDQTAAAVEVVYTF